MIPRRDPIFRWLRGEAGGGEDGELSFGVSEEL